ncbi:MAG: hypothetical protein KAI66_02195, partial [Lentisphaeria bacterium]|nr:hypothetical protein [Lentisphaeria bacterium]
DCLSGPEQPAMCENLQCVRGCRDSSQCPAGTYCNTELSDCVTGCENDTDCPAGETCIDNACVQGCANDDECELGQICGESGQCEAGCNTDRDCPGGTFCAEEGICLAGCISDDDCGWGDHCWLDEHACVECLNDDHCIMGACDLSSHTCTRTCSRDQECQGNDVCDTTAEPSICVECYADDTGNCDGSGLLCDTSNRVCVECLEDTDCAEGESCDPIAQVCLVDTGRTLCESCTDDAQCGLAGDRCQIFVDGDGLEVDRGCGVACSDGVLCPAGYLCETGAAGTDGQCRPASAEPVVTCAGMRAVGQPCAGIGANCGLPDVADGTCVFDLGGSYCSVQCDDGLGEAACLEGMSCSNLVVLNLCMPD